MGVNQHSGMQCIVYARYETGIENDCCQGNAKGCANQARSCGYDVGSKPKVNSIMVMGPWNGGSSVGHDAIVIDVDKNDPSRVKVRDSNWNYDEYTREHWIDTDAKDASGNPIYGSFEYVYCEENESTPQPKPQSQTAQSDCIGNVCWYPRGSTCNDASQWFKLGKIPFATYGGVELCDEIYHTSNEIISAYNQNDAVPEEHWWRATWRNIIGIFGTYVDADDIRNYVVQRTLIVQKDGIKVVSGNGVQWSDVTGFGQYVVTAEKPQKGLPDFIPEEVQITKHDGTEQYTWSVSDNPYVHTWFSNIGDADWDDSDETKLEWRAYLSHGYKEDSHKEWIRVGKGDVKKEHMTRDSEPNHEKLTLDLWDLYVTRQIIPGEVYNIVMCIDRTKDHDNGDGEVKEKHKSNNCTTEAVFKLTDDAPLIPKPDLVIQGLSLTNGRTSLNAGDYYGLQMYVTNTGNAHVTTGIISDYAIKGPGTNNQWIRVTDDRSDANELKMGKSVYEHITDGFRAQIPYAPGTYTARGCADSTNVVDESNEQNNCTTITFTVKPLAQPSVTITSPAPGEKWKSDDKQTIRWTSTNLPWNEPIIVQYYCRGNWYTIYDGYTANDHKKYWEMKKNRTKDDSNGRIRIIRQSTGHVLGESAPFLIDHKKGTPEL